MSATGKDDAAEKTAPAFPSDFEITIAEELLADFLIFIKTPEAKAFSQAVLDLLDAIKESGRGPSE